MVTGPSGAGKDSVIERAQQKGLKFATITTTSTRPMRVGEADGNPYYFISSDEFQKKIKNGEMIEWAQVYGHYYGSTRQEVEDKLKKNEVVIIKVDPQGARAFKKVIEDAKTIFIKPPSFEYLEKRLVNRAADSPEVIKKRLAIAREELSDLTSWDEVIINNEGELDKAAEDLIRIVENFL